MILKTQIIRRNYYSLKQVKKIILCVESRAPCDLSKRYHQQFVVSLVCFNSNQSPLVPRRTVKLGVIDKSLAYKHPVSL